MKKIILFTCASLALLSCAKIENGSNLSEIPLGTISIENIIDYSLSLSDIQAFVQSESLMTKADEITIEPIVDEENDTVFYLVNYPQGWKLLASDMRVYPVVAANITGQFSDLLESENAQSWLDGMAIDMKILKGTNTEDLRLCKEEVAANIEFWKDILQSDSFLKSYIPSTKVSPPFDDPIERLPRGSYYLYTTTHVEEDYEVNRLTTTCWSQQEPFNVYCPFSQQFQGYHMWAGSVTIATAQLLYYLHYKDGVPSQAPSQAYVYHTESLPSNGYLGMGQSDFSSTIWDDMPTNVDETNTAAAPFVANVAVGVQTYFCDTVGLYQEHPDKVDDVLLSPYGVDSHYSEYDSDAAIASLVAGYPVVTTAAAERSWFFGYSYSRYHTQLLDGYIKTRIKTTKVYRWVYSGTNHTGFLPAVPDSLAVSYSTPEIKYIQFNWGNGSIGGNNETRFALTDSWIYNSGYSQLNYQYDRTMTVVDY